MNRALKFCKVLNTLSIDIAFGAVASSLFFSLVFKRQISSLVLISLGLSVWIIYTADHLLDVRNSKTTMVSDRHQFHHTNFHLLKWILISGAWIDFILITQLPTTLIYVGSALGVMVILYVLFNRKLGASKELMAAVFYTFGVCMPALAFTGEQMPLNQRLLIIQFFTTVLINLILFSLIDKNEDKANGFISIATQKGSTQVSFLLILLFLVSTGLFFAQLQVGASWQPISILFLMNFILSLLFTFRKYYVVRKYYRLVGDAVFLLPCLVVVS